MLPEIYAYILTLKKKNLIRLRVFSHDPFLVSDTDRREETNQRLKSFFAMAKEMFFFKLFLRLIFCYK
jgi:hypothetical protein